MDAQTEVLVRALERLREVLALVEAGELRPRRTSIELQRLQAITYTGTAGTFRQTTVPSKAPSSQVRNLHRLCEPRRCGTWVTTGS